MWACLSDLYQHIYKLSQVPSRCSGMYSSQASSQFCIALSEFIFTFLGLPNPWYLIKIVSFQALSKEFYSMWTWKWGCLGDVICNFSWMCICPCGPYLSIFFRRLNCITSSVWWLPETKKRCVPWVLVDSISWESCSSVSPNGVNCFLFGWWGSARNLWRYGASKVSLLLDFSIRWSIPQIYFFGIAVVSLNQD
jgi:hypothetical protein